MAYEFYFECDQPRIGKIRCYAMSYGTTTLSGGNLNPAFEWRREALTGQASGSRQHSSITITKDIDPPSASMFASCIGKELHSVKLNFYRPDPKGSGDSQLFYAITLAHAVLTRGARKILPIRSSGGSGYTTREVEEVQITFKKIEVSNVTGKTMSSDSWSQAA